MAMTNYITQPVGVGIRRQLNELEAEHIVCLLRAIERLPLLSEAPGAPRSFQCMERQLAGIHANHLELAAYASIALSGKTPC